MQNVNISNFRKDLFNYVNQAIEFGEPINVSAKNGNVIVISEEEYRGMEETMYLLSNPKMREILIEGMKTPREEFEEIDWEKDLKDMGL